MGNTSDGPHVCRHVRPCGGPSHLLRRVASTLRAAYPTHAVHSTHARTRHAGYTNHLWAYAAHARAKYPRRYAEPSRRVLPFRRHPRQPCPASSCIVDVRRPPVYCARVGKHRNWLLAGRSRFRCARHRRPTGTVCLRGRGSDRWHRTIRVSFGMKMGMKGTACIGRLLQTAGTTARAVTMLHAMAATMATRSTLHHLK